jgi:hypothetical protein
VATISYLGKGNKNGHGDELDREKIEGLRLQNAIARSKLQRLAGEFVSKREVTFALSHALILLRTQILTVPGLVSAELRDLDTQAQHRVRMRVEGAVHRFLTQLSENMEAAMHSEEFIAKLKAELAGKTDDDAAKLKRDLAKQKRTEKRNAKARKQS